MSIGAPPVDVGAVTVTVACVVLPVATFADTDAGADGATALIPRMITAVPVSVAPPESVVTAVIVN